MGAPAVVSPVVDLSTAASECGVGTTRHLERLDAPLMVDSLEGCGEVVSGGITFVIGGFQALLSFC